MIALHSMVWWGCYFPTQQPWPLANPIVLHEKFFLISVSISFNTCLWISSQKKVILRIILDIVNFRAFASSLVFSVTGRIIIRSACLILFQLTFFVLFSFLFDSLTDQDQIKALLGTQEMLNSKIFFMHVYFTLW